MLINGRNLVFFGEMALPTGRQLIAARALAGLEQREVAAKARINVTTLYRMEACGKNKVRGLGSNIEAVIDVLRKAGVEIVDDPLGVRVLSQPRKK